MHISAVNHMVFDRWVICRDYMVQIHDYVYVGNNWVVKGVMSSQHQGLRGVLFRLYHRKTFQFSVPSAGGGNGSWDLLTLN